MENKGTFELINDLIIAISNLLWPILVFVALLMFKKEITKLVPRIKSWKIFGNEIEIDKEIDALKYEVEKTNKQIPEIANKPNKENVPEDFSVLADQDPKLALIKLAIEIEKEMKILVGSLGVIKGQQYISLQQSFDLLHQRGALPRHTQSSLKIFGDLRNKLVHGQNEDNENIIRVLDIGLTLLKTLKAVPHEVNRVYHPGVEIYSNKECTNKVANALGLILETTSPGGAKKSLRIFPTTKVGYYKKGIIVSWEWDLSHVWDKSWYIDPDSGEKKQAWGSAGEFVGRHIEEI